MSNTNNTMQTQTSNALHNAIMEAGGKDRSPMLAPVAKGSSESTTEGYMENYKNVLEDIRNLLNVEAKDVHIILTRIDNDIYFTFDACSNAMEIKFTSRDGESLESYYSRFYKIMNELVKNKCEVTNHQVNVQILLQLQPEWQRFLTLVKQSQELKIVSYHKLQNQNEVNEIRVKRLARKAIFNSLPPIYDQEPDMVTKDDAFSKEKENDKLMDLISLSFKKIYKPTNNNLRTSSNTSRANQDNTPRINRGTGYDNQRAVNVAGARENIVDWRDDTDDEPKDQELEAHYMYMAQIQEVTLDAADNSGPVIDTKPLQNVQNDDDNYNVFSNDIQHPEQPEYVNDTYPDEQGDINITTDLVDMSTNGEEVDHDDDDLARKRGLLASLIKKLKCDTDDSKNHNKILQSSNKTLVDKLESEIEDLKNKNKCLESSNNHFKEANTELAKNNQLIFKELKKFQAELDRFLNFGLGSSTSTIIGTMNHGSEVIGTGIIVNDWTAFCRSDDIRYLICGGQHIKYTVLVVYGNYHGVIGFAKAKGEATPSASQKILHVEFISKIVLRQPRLEVQTPATQDPQICKSSSIFIDISFTRLTESALLASDVNVSLKTIAGNSVSIDPRS
ncbi:retrovirus-related pol polyprotein from transposon TNT 1-94 [Tanacetum coccineum]|uniref:Retrovirus-related pol polyprotein from transposon TNT 1-94 n=1 Tax=Tanacetum coccineum TaxID=301880 RepID=A0ABQ5DKJ7_9ASTR